MAEAPYDGAVGWAQPGIPGGRRQLAWAGEGTAEGRQEEVLRWVLEREGRDMTGAGAVRILCCFMLTCVLRNFLPSLLLVSNHSSYPFLAAAT